MVSIHPYQPDIDEPGAFELWQAAFGSTWPLTRDIFHRVTVGVASYRTGDHFVAEEHDALVGFVMTQADRAAVPLGTGHLGALVVAPAVQRSGIGRALHDAALAHLRETGVHQLQLGGGDAYLWPGVPSALSPALAFFAAQGWSYAETTYDLVRDVRQYVSPPAILQRVADQGITLEVGTHAQVAELLTFVAREFPSWTASYRSVAALADYADFLLARDNNRRIIGAVVMSSPLSHPQQLSVRWKTLLGKDAGAIGVVGVAATERNRGVGHALVARASEIVRDRGARQCFIGWAWMIGLYGELEYQTWQEYRMSQRGVCAV